MSSLTNREVYIGHYVVKPRKEGFLVRGLATSNQGKKFSLKRLEAGKWSLSGSVSNGKQERVRKRFQALGLEEAVQEAEQILYGRGVVSSGEHLIPDIFSKWMKTLTVGEGALKNHKDCTKYFLDWCEPQGLRCWDDLRLEHLEAYALSLVESQKKPRTIKLYTLPIRMAARWVSQNWPERYQDFSAGFRLPKPSGEYLISDPDQRATLSLQEVGKFLVFLRTTKMGWKLIPGIALQGLCGLRVREVFRLRWDRIDLNEKVLTIEGRVKNQHSVRRLPLPELVAEILAASPKQGAHVISAYGTDNHYAIAIKKAIKKWRASLNLEPKGLRRTLPSVGIREGWHNYALERYIGHSPKTITERHYVLPSQDEMEELFKKEITDKVDAVMSLFLKVWQHNGKKKDNEFLEK